jgi:hypothetical protein
MISLTLNVSLQPYLSYVVPSLMQFFFFHNRILEALCMTALKMRRSDGRYMGACLPSFPLIVFLAFIPLSALLKVPPPAPHIQYLTGIAERWGIAIK